MGCFNNYGFYSHLPIKSGDEIVLIFCKNYGDGTEAQYNYPSSLSSELEPISLPIVGKYNDYGYIEDITEDYNIHNFQSLSQGVGDCFGNFRKDISNEEFLHFMDKLRLDHDYSRLTYIIELKSIYDKISGLISIDEYLPTSFDRYSPMSFDTGWDEVKKFKETFSEISSNGTITQLINLLYSSEHFTESKKARTFLESLEYLNISILHSCDGFCSHVPIDFANLELREVVKKFFNFNLFILNFGGYLIESKYCNQDWEPSAKALFELKKFEVELLKKWKENLQNSTMN